VVELRHAPALEHGTTPSGRWLRARRIRFALWIAVVEGLLVVFDVIPWWLAVAVAGAVIAFWLFAGRKLRSDAVRQASWIAAASQAFMALVPVLVILVGTLALVAVGVLAVVALVFLFADRR